MGRGKIKERRLIMEIGDVVDRKEYVAYENCCREIAAIETKLFDGKIPEGKREKLLYRKKILETKVLPRLVKKINI